MVVAVAALLLAAAVPAAGRTKNVLFIVADDMRAQLHGEYDNGLSVLTPNMNALRDRSLTFDRAYTHIPVCNPSRTSFLTGRRTDVMGVNRFSTWFRETANGNRSVTIQESFRKNGYDVRGTGKLFGYVGRGGLYDLDRSYDEDEHSRDYVRTRCEENAVYCALELEDHDNMEQDVLGWIEELTVAQNAQEDPRDRRPWLIMAGIYNPHLPYVYREENEDVYDFQEDFPYADQTSSSSSLGDCGRLRNQKNPYQQFGGGEQFQFPINASNSDVLQRAYYTSLYEADRIVGSFVDQLVAQGVLDDTIIVVTSDHGYSLGERGQWGKFVLYEDALRVPLIMHLPGWGVRGLHTDEFISLIDLYPTISDLVDVPYDTSVVEGKSFAPLINKVTTRGPRRRGIHSMYAIQDELVSVEGINYVESTTGYTVRTSAFRFTTWCDSDQMSMLPLGLRMDMESCRCHELYDNRNAVHDDFDTFETENVFDPNNPVLMEVAESLMGNLRDYYIGERPLHTLPPQLEPVGSCLDGSFRLNVDYLQSSFVRLLVSTGQAKDVTRDHTEACTGMVVVINKEENDVRTVRVVDGRASIRMASIQCGTTLQIVDMANCIPSRPFLVTAGESTRVGSADHWQDYED